MRLLDKYIARMENIMSHAKLVVLPGHSDKDNMMGTIA